jgi:hypothetical protein
MQVAKTFFLNTIPKMNKGKKCRLNISEFDPARFIHKGKMSTACRQYMVLYQWNE